jgi:uncharacterized protein (DUF305 family)
MTRLLGRRPLRLAPLFLAVPLTSGLSAQVRHTAADVAFMQGMIHHHAQALVMARLVPDRTATTPIRMLAERIDVSQQDEIALMRQWLLDRKEAAPAGDPEHQHGPAHGHGELMPGMLSAEELTRLAAARGREFDRLFLEFMIRHHEGALVMVAQLFRSPGAGQDTEIFRFASDVEADQRAEIRRMQALLKTLSDSEGERR